MCDTERADTLRWYALTNYSSLSEKDPMRQCMLVPVFHVHAHGGMFFSLLTTEQQQMIILRTL